MKFYLLFFLLMAFFSCGKAQQNFRIPVVPYPREVIQGEGIFSPEDQLVGLRFSGIPERMKAILAGQLTESIKKKFDLEITILSTKPPDIWIGIPQDDKDLSALCRTYNCFPSVELGEEGYILLINKKIIIITANSEAGAFYGVQSLCQLLRGTPGETGIPCLQIRDWPSFAYRCVMDDISRGPVPKADFLKSQVRRYAELKINLMSFYIENVVKTELYPDFGPADGAISIEEFRNLSEYAADYNIKLMGNFQSLGHFEKILSYPQYRHIGATDRMLDPMNPDAIKFLRNIYKEMAPAFSSVFFNPDCDEAWDLSRSQIVKGIDSLGVSRIYADHIKRIDSTLTELGKTTIIWSDIILGYPEILDIIPQHIIIGVWDYSASESFADLIDPIKNKGFKFTVSPGILNSNRIMPDYRTTTTNISNLINEGYKKGAIGVICTVWDDGGRSFFSPDWYGIAYNAEQSWNPDVEPLNDFDTRFSRSIYGDMSNSIPQYVHDINRLADLAPTYEMNENILYKTLIPKRGEHVAFNPQDCYSIKEINDKALYSLNNNKISAYTDDILYFEFISQEYAFTSESRLQLIEVANLYRSACFSQLMNRNESLQLLMKAKDIVLHLRNESDSLANNFEKLWNMENRPYWLQQAMTIDITRKEDLNDLNLLLNNAIESFKVGEFLPPPEDVRLDIRINKESYFQYWLICGSFPIHEYTDGLEDFLIKSGGEANIIPYPGMTINSNDNQSFTWVKYDSPQATEIDLASLFEYNTKAVAYAYCTINSEESRTVKALAGSNDGMTIYCNSKLVFQKHIKRDLIPDEDEIILDLIKGRNHIMIKIDQWKADWAFSFRLADEDVRNHKHNYYIIKK